MSTCHYRCSRASTHIVSSHPEAASHRNQVFSAGGFFLLPRVYLVLCLGKSKRQVESWGCALLLWDSLEKCGPHCLSEVASRVGFQMLQHNKLHLIYFCPIPLYTQQPECLGFSSKETACAKSCISGSDPKICAPYSPSCFLGPTFLF